MLINLINLEQFQSAAERFNYKEANKQFNIKKIQEVCSPSLFNTTSQH